MSVQSNAVQEFPELENGGSIPEVVPLLRWLVSGILPVTSQEWEACALSIPFKITSWDSHSVSLAVTSCFSDDTFLIPQGSAPQPQGFSISLH